MSDVLGESFIGQLEYLSCLQARSGSDRHQRARVADGAWRRWPTTTRSCRQAQYRLLELWQQTYQGELLILLPDTFGTTQFLENAPDWVADWTGQRIDSKDPFICGRRIHCVAARARARSAARSG